MGSFSVWHWLIVLGIFGGIGYAIYRSSKSGRTDNGEPLGFGGWLMLLAIGQTLAPLRALFSTLENFQYRDQLSAMPGGNAAFWSEMALNTCFVLAVIATTVMMYRRSAAFKTLFAVQWLLIPIVYFVDAALVSVLLGLPLPSLIDPTGFSAMALGFVLGGLWYWYLRVSVRARNTFVN